MKAVWEKWSRLLATADNHDGLSAERRGWYNGIWANTAICSLDGVGGAVSTNARAADTLFAEKSHCKACSSNPSRSD